MDGHSLNTYCVIIRNHRQFDRVAKEAVCFLRQGYRGLLVSVDPPNARHFTIVKRYSGNQSKSFEPLAWVRTNLLKEARENKHGSKADQDKSIQLWARARVLVDQAHQAEAEARLEVARAHRGQPVTIEGKTFYPTASVTKEGLETILFYENDGIPKLDTV